MNGYGHFLPAWGWFNLYWSLAPLVLVVAVHLLWPRGQETGFRQRLRLAVQRSRGRARGGCWRLVLLAFAGTGAFIFYNTNVLNQYRTSSRPASASRSTTSGSTSSTRRSRSPG